jgi:MFS family permease
MPIPLARLWLAVLLGYLALGATLQELPSYVSERFAAGPFVVGVTVGIAFAGTALARPFAGRAGDAGWSRGVAASGGVLTALAAVGHLVAPGIGPLLAARVAMGIGEAALFSGILPWVLSASEPGRSGRAAGWFGLSMWGGLAAGPLLTVAAHAVGDSSTLWALVIALPVGSTILVLSTRPPVGTKARIRVRGWRELVPAGVGAPGAVLGLAAYGYGTLTALLVLFLGRPGMGGRQLGLVVFALAFLGTRAAGSPLVDRLGALAVVRVVLVVDVVGFAVLALAGSAIVALCAVAAIGIGLGLIYPATSKLTLARTAQLSGGAALGAMTSLWDLGVLVAGPVGGLAAAVGGFRVAFWVAAASCVAALLLAVRPWRECVKLGEARVELGEGNSAGGEAIQEVGVPVGARPARRYEAGFRP